MTYTIKELEEQTCQSFGGNNCVLHGCMFGCQLEAAKKKAAREKEVEQEPDYDNQGKDYEADERWAAQPTPYDP